VKAYSSSLKRLRLNISIPACSTRKRSVSRYIAKRIIMLNGSIEREQKGRQAPHILVSSPLSASHTAPGCVKSKNTERYYSPSLKVLCHAGGMHTTCGQAILHRLPRRLQPETSKWRLRLEETSIEKRRE